MILDLKTPLESQGCHSI